MKLSIKRSIKTFGKPQSIRAKPDRDPPSLLQFFSPFSSTFELVACFLSPLVPRLFLVSQNGFYYGCWSWCRYRCFSGMFCFVFSLVGEVVSVMKWDSTN